MWGLRKITDFASTQRKITSKICDFVLGIFIFLFTACDRMYIKTFSSHSM
jgi:hypothetical protein